MLNLCDIARVRRIVAVMAREMAVTRRSARPQRPRMGRLLRRILG